MNHTTYCAVVTIVLRNPPTSQSGSTFFKALAALLLLVLIGFSVIQLAHSDAAIRVDASFANARLADYTVISDSEVRFSLARDQDQHEGLWFRFRIAADQPVQPDFVLENTADAAQQNWRVVRPVFSIDGETWVPAELARLETSFADRLKAKVSGRPTGFRFRAPFEATEFEVAYAYPYDNTMLNAWLSDIEHREGVAVSSIGDSSHNMPIALITITPDADDATQAYNEVWIIGREHPGETPSSFFVEGLTEALIDARTRFPSTAFKIVPLINPNGVANGLYYRNTEGIDLAKDWQATQSAEIAALRQAMQASLERGGVALVINAHGANAPSSHFMIEPLRRLQSDEMFLNQQRIMRGLKGIHPQFSLDNRIEMWDLPGICGNWLPTQHNTYCLYIESNYSIGADGSRVTPATLRDFGARMVDFLADYLGEVETNVVAG